jgi:hypothetical protein
MNTAPPNVILSGAKNLGPYSGSDLGQNRPEMFRFAQQDRTIYEVRSETSLW